MDWQLAVVAAAVSGAMCYVGRATWRTWAGPKAGCGAGCGKCAAPPVQPAGRRIGLPMAHGS